MAAMPGENLPSGGLANYSGRIRLVIAAKNDDIRS
jgi:hypothetical protein